MKHLSKRPSICDVPGRGVCTPRKPKTIEQSRIIEQRRRRPEPVCVFYREGNRAIPVQPIYEDAPSEDKSES